MIHSMVYTEQNGLQEEIPLQEISNLISSGQNIVWLDIQQPTEKDMRILSEEFGFHPLSLEDSIHERQRPKVDRYEKYLFLVTRWISNHNHDRFTTHQLAIFIGKNYIVTVHKIPLPAIKECIERIESEYDLMKHGVGFLLYFVMDTIVDSYFPVMDSLEEHLDSIEKRIFIKNSDIDVEEIFKLRQNLLIFRKVVSPLRETFNTLTRQGNTSILPEQSLVYFEDIYDHLIQIADMIDNYRDILTNTMDAYLSVVSNRMNGIMKTLTIVATIAMPLTLLTGIEGMNYKYMPELNWRYSYPVALSGMVLTIVGLTLWFKHKKWF